MRRHDYKAALYRPTKMPRGSKLAFVGYEEEGKWKALTLASALMSQAVEEDEAQDWELRFMNEDDRAFQEVVGAVLLDCWLIVRTEPDLAQLDRG